MSEPVKRYNMDADKFGNVRSYPSEHGRWVKRDDYARLEQECERLRDQKADWHGRAVELGERLDAALKQVDALKEERTKLMDRNVDLRCLLTKQIKRTDGAKEALESIAKSETAVGDIARSALAEIAKWESKP